MSQNDRKEAPIRRLPEGWSSERCKIDEMTASDIPAAQQLYLGSRYIEKWDGLETDPLFAERHYNGEDLPPGGVKERLQNQIVRSLEDGTPIGMLSVYHGYPNDSVMYIGFFCIDPSAQSKGFGWEVIGLVNAMAERLGYGETRVAAALKNWRCDFGAGAASTGLCALSGIRCMRRAPSARSSSQIICNETHSGNIAVTEKASFYRGLFFIFGQLCPYVLKI